MHVALQLITLSGIVYNIKYRHAKGRTFISNKFFLYNNKKFEIENIDARTNHLAMRVKNYNLYHSRIYIKYALPRNIEAKQPYL